jgi:hypothetical protein
MNRVSDSRWKVYNGENVSTVPAAFRNPFTWILTAFKNFFVVALADLKTAGIIGSVLMAAVVKQIFALLSN